MRVFTVILVLGIVGVLIFEHSIAQTTSGESRLGDANLRGISVAQTHDGDFVLWATGTKETIIRSLNHGASWEHETVDGGMNLDFRDVEAFGANTAFIMSSGDGAASRIFKTIDGGKSWSLQYSDKRPGFFLDSLACSSPTDCFALSDPVEGKFLVLATRDGEHWKELARDKMPAALPNEGAFAASGTSIALCGNNIYFGTGGPAARVFRSADGGVSWTVAATPVANGKASAGIFSVACAGKHVVAVGGDYKNPDSADRVSAYSDDFGKTWRLAERPPSGYRSAVAVASGGVLSVGPNGEDVSVDYGIHWKAAGSTNLNAVALTPDGNAWAVGPQGTIKHFAVKF